MTCRLIIFHWKPIRRRGSTGERIGEPIVKPRQTTVRSVDRVRKTLKRREWIVLIKQNPDTRKTFSLCLRPRTVSDTWRSLIEEYLHRITCFNRAYLLLTSYRIESYSACSKIYHTITIIILILCLFFFSTTCRTRLNGSLEQPPPPTGRKLESSRSA